MTVLKVTTAATAMRVSGGALFGIGVEGRAGGGGGWEGRGEESGSGGLSPATPPRSNWQWRWWWHSLRAFPVFHSGLCVLVGDRWRWQGWAEVVMGAVARQVLV
jgi:hypothetical protein